MPKPTKALSIKQPCIPYVDAPEAVRVGFIWLATSQLRQAHPLAQTLHFWHGERPLCSENCAVAINHDAYGWDYKPRKDPSCYHNYGETIWHKELRAQATEETDNAQPRGT